MQKQFWCNQRYYTGISLEGLRKGKRNLSQEQLCVPDYTLNGHLQNTSQKHYQLIKLAWFGTQSFN